jgi:ribosomal-protein-alanine N-acetyltransferase
MAWARFDESGGKVVHLYQMWVSPLFRGNGLARKLLYTAMQWATSRGARAMILDVTCGDTPARKLYDSTGFESIGIPEPLRPGSKLEVQRMKFVFTEAGI